MKELFKNSILSNFLNKSDFNSISLTGIIWERLKKVPSLDLTKIQFQVIPEGDSLVLTADNLYSALAVQFTTDGLPGDIETIQNDTWVDSYGNVYEYNDTTKWFSIQLKKPIKRLCGTYTIEERK